MGRGPGTDVTVTTEPYVLNTLPTPAQLAHFCAHAVSLMDEDRQVAWMRATLPHTPYFYAQGNLVTVGWGPRIFVFARRYHIVKFFSNAPNTRCQYTSNFGFVISDLVRAMQLTQSQMRE